MRRRRERGRGRREDSIRRNASARQRNADTNTKRPTEEQGERKEQTDESDRINETRRDTENTPIESEERKREVFNGLLLPQMKPKKKKKRARERKETQHRRVREAGRKGPFEQPTSSSSLFPRPTRQVLFPSSFFFALLSHTYTHRSLCD